MSRLAELTVAADVGAWRRAGVAVDADGHTTLGTVRLRFEEPGGETTGVRGWGVVAPETPVPPEVEGLTTWAVDEPPAPAPPTDHPLGIVRIDHVVVITPDLDRTCAAVAAAFGVPLRRRRDGPSGSGAPAQQAFFRLGEVILELVAGPTEESVHFWGLALEVVSLDAAVAHLGPEGVRDPKPAVQPGRRIASVRAEAGLGFPVALMDTPRRAPGE